LSAHVEKQYDAAHCMEMPPPQTHLLPSRKLSYDYTVAMYFAQQLELNLRAILYTAEYHAFIDIPLTPEQEDRYKTLEGFIDNSTCGLLIEKLRGAIRLKDKNLWRAFDRACQHRNRLAHSLLAEQDFDALSATEEDALITELRKISMEIYKGLLISRAIREQIDRHSDADHASMKQTMAELGVANYENQKRKYTHARKRHSNTKA
jgi:hypothetical protein